MLALRVRVGDTEADAKGDGEILAESEKEPLAVPVALGDSDSVKGEADKVRDGVTDMELILVGLTVEVAVNDAVADSDGVTDCDALTLLDTLGVADVVPVGVTDGVGVGEPDQLGEVDDVVDTVSEDVTDEVPVRLGLGETDACADLDGDTVVDGATDELPDAEPDVVGVGVADTELEAARDGVTLGEAKREPDTDGVAEA